MADHTEKRIRREIANSNERRRMQSINTGFNSLRTMLPKHDGEKLSKAAILQHTAEYIDSLEQEKTRLLAQQYQLKRLVTSIINGQADIKDLHEHQLLKKIKLDHHPGDTDSSDEGICNASPIEAMDGTDDLKSELIEVRKTVDRERKLRMQLEDTIKSLETQLHPERVKEITHNVQVKLHHQQYEVSFRVHTLSASSFFSNHCLSCHCHLIRVCIYLSLTFSPFHSLLLEPNI
jgi:transcription factor AP-4